MTTIVHRDQSRGAANYGWLNTRYSFSFASWFDPERMGFGLLRVLNDDIIEGGYGFDPHPHKNMEIVTIPLEGGLSHTDSGGNEEVIRQDDVQVMSAGSGVTHSEYNASPTELSKLLQIWILPDEINIAPRYDQKTFDRAERHNAFQTVASGERGTGALWINQDARVSLATIDAQAAFPYTMKSPNHGVYLFVIEGSISIDEIILNRRDAIGISDGDTFSIAVHSRTELLAIEVPMQKS